MKQVRKLVRMTMALGVLSLVCLALSALALNDIAHGGEDLGLEWATVRVSALVFLMFITLALITLRRTTGGASDPGSE